MHNQGLHWLYLTVHWVLAGHGVRVEASRGPLKGVVSAQNTLQESETETRELLGGTEENCVSPLGKSVIFYNSLSQEALGGPSPALF